MGEVVLLRKLTRKSIIEHGRNKGMSIADMLKIKKMDLIYIYFNYDSLTFMDDILDELKISKEDRITKPGKNKEVFSKYANRNNFVNLLYIHKDKSKAKTIIFQKRKSYYKGRLKGLSQREKFLFSKGNMQRINQGK